MPQGNRLDYAVYVTREGRDNKVYYTRIGSAWTVGNNGISLKLDALPVSGECVMFPPREEEPR